MKRWQNKVAESRYTQPSAILLGTAVWLLAGLVVHQWWIQFACFVLTTWILTELNNSHALIRIFSRLVSSAFVLVFCSASFLFASLPGAIFQLCFISSLYTFFNGYQDKESAGWTFYTFLLLSLGSTATADGLLLVPVYWLLMAVTLNSFSRKTFVASWLGLLLPYATWSAGILLLNEGDFTPLAEHLGLTETSAWGQLITRGDLMQMVPVYTSLSLSQILCFALTVALSLTGVIHFVRKSTHDKIRTRQIFYSMMVVNGYATLLLIAMPSRIDTMLRLMILTASPLIGHFLALTSTKITNIAFFVILGVTALLTVFNLWTL